MTNNITAPAASLAAEGGIAQDLIYDVGMHNGDDTDYYLHQGYRVLAIEADPFLVKQAEERFASQLQTGQLTILNVGIAERSGTSMFWICDENRLWNSFDERIASRNRCRHHAISIATRRFADILNAFAIPIYLKIDIEGNDHLCVRDLLGRPLPVFISMESECAGDGRWLSETESLITLRLLHDAGYRRFKLISQTDLQPAWGQPDGILRKGLNSLAFGKLRMPVLASFFMQVTPLGKLSKRCGHSFPLGSTGPWGNQAQGDWLTFDQARTVYLEARARYFASPHSQQPSFWCDWHATIK